MFTGIVEEIGTVQKIIKNGNSLQMAIQAMKILEDVKLGDSIAVNGVCLTVTSFSSQLFTVDVMPETFHSTSLASLKNGSFVNLERALAANGRFGGHFVTGHIDGTGVILRKEAKENAIYIDISIPETGQAYVMEKGSIGIDGTSLTTFGVNDEFVTVSLIPHTANETILGMKNIGDKVNIEFDMLAKYVQLALAKKTEDSTHKSKMTVDFLKENGFA